MDGWMDVVREEDDGGRRERVEARLDDASRLLVAYAKLGTILKVRPKTRRSSQSPNFCELA